MQIKNDLITNSPGVDMKKLLLILLGVACATSSPKQFEVWTYPYLKPMLKAELSPAAVKKTIHLKVTPGEYEPAAFAVRPSQRVELSVSLAGGRQGKPLPDQWCEIHLVKSLADSTEPNRVHQIDGPVELPPESTAYFWITVRPPEGTEAGIYSSRLLLESGNSEQGLEISCEVLPFSLEESPVTGGVFMNLIDLPPGWYKDMKDHGLDAIQFFTWERIVRDSTILRHRGDWDVEPIKITRRNDKMVLDFSSMDRIMDDLTASGMKGPVVISLGNDHFMHYECRLAQVMGIPIDTTRNKRRQFWGPAVTPRLDSLFADGLRQMRDHWKEKNYPQELVVLIYDEPTHGLLERGRNRYRLLKQVTPDIKVYGVVMDKRELAEQVQDQCDIIVSNGDFDGVRQVANKYGKGFYVYGSMGTANYARFRMGCMPWRTKAEGAFFWMYNYWYYSPDRCAVYQHPDYPDKLVRSIQWEAVREGMDDLRYFATAEKLIQQAPAGEKEAAQKRLDEVRNSIDPEYRYNPPKEKMQDEKAVLDYYLESQRVRDEVISIIMELI